MLHENDRFCVVIYENKSNSDNCLLNNKSCQNVFSVPLSTTDIFSPEVNSVRNYVLNTLKDVKCSLALMIKSF